MSSLQGVMGYEGAVRGCGGHGVGGGGRQREAVIGSDRRRLC